MFFRYEGGEPLTGQDLLDASIISDMFHVAGLATGAIREARPDVDEDLCEECGYELDDRLDDTLCKSCQRFRETCSECDTALDADEVGGLCDLCATDLEDDFGEDW